MSSCHAQVNLTRIKCIPEYDLSNVRYPNNDTEIYHVTWEIGIKTILYTVGLLIALFGNIIVICTVSFNRHMRSTTNIFIANLAAGDLLIALCPMWVKMVSGFSRQFLLGEAICKMWPFIQVTSMCGSVFTMTAIACDRFFAVVFPLKSKTTKRNVYVIIGVLWLMSFVIGIPLLFAYELRQRNWKDLFESYCNEEFSWLMCDVHPCEIRGLQHLYRKIYWTVVCAVVNWIPMAIMTVGYMAIAVIMYQRNSVVPNTCQNSQGGSVQHRSMKKVLRMLFIVLMTFIVCWVPFQVSLIYSIYRNDADKTPEAWFEPFQSWSIMVAHYNSAINPIIYAGLNENFRKGFLYVFLCWRRQHYRERRSLYTRSSVISQTSPGNNTYTRTRLTSTKGDDKMANGDYDGSLLKRGESTDYYGDSAL